MTLETTELMPAWRHDEKTPEDLGALEPVETEAGVPLVDSERGASLRDLAEWSVTTAELDWEHAEDVDRRGWRADSD